MINKQRNRGFTLTEVLISAGILSVGFMLIAGAFPVGVKLTSLATERSIGSVTAQEAISKIKLCGFSIPPSAIPANQCVDYETIFGLGFIPSPVTPLDPAIQYSQLYPSTSMVELEDKKYHWSALCRYTGPLPGGVPVPGQDSLQVTVFVSRLDQPGTTYPGPAGSPVNVPKPYPISGVQLASGNSLKISSAYKDYFREDSVIVDSRNGNLYTVMEKTNNGTTVTVLLNRDWVNPLPPLGTYYVWVIPSAISPGGPVLPEGGLAFGFIRIQ